MAYARPLVAALVVLAAGIVPVAAARAADPGPYVALGDSYTAGPLVFKQVGEPLGCLRSDRNYPSIVRGATGAAPFRDASCSGASTRDLTAPQPVLLGTNPPQLDALNADVGLVTLGIGGNDVGLVGAAVTCAGLGLVTPTGTSCRRSFVRPGGGDALVEEIATTAPKIAATLQAIHARAPRARVLVVGYPDVAPGDGRSCYPLVPLSADDTAYLDAMLRQTNAMLAEQAAANDAEFVDTYKESHGHDVCKPPGQRWFEGLLPTADAFPLHPNALGQAGMARSVLRVLGEPKPGAVLGPLRRSQRTITAGRGLRVAYTASRPSSVTFALQRSQGGGRYSAPRPLAAPDAQAGENVLTLPPPQLGRRVGLYRLTATPAGGGSQVVQFRIRRAPGVSARGSSGGSRASGHR